MSFRKVLCVLALVFILGMIPAFGQDYDWTLSDEFGQFQSGQSTSQEVTWIVTITYRRVRGGPSQTVPYEVSSSDSSGAETKARNQFVAQYPNYIFVSANALKKVNL
jgi:hypothetical protein